MFDDRLDTVLRMRVSSATSARTQLRQLIDLLGSAAGNDALGGAEAGYDKLAELLELIAEEDLSRIIREPGLRLRNPHLVAWLASGSPKPAAAAMATARLSDDQWQALIPRLPIIARGFLRHRRDLPPGAKRVLAQLGVGDMVLPDLAPRERIPLAPTPAESEAREGIGALLKRIEAFRETRRQPGTAPRLPLDEPADTALPLGDELDHIAFRTDASGQVIWASAEAAPAMVGMMLTGVYPVDLVATSVRVQSSLRQHLTLHSARLDIDAAPAISGEWLMDAVPIFADPGGSFAGYSGLLYRPALLDPADAPDSHADMMRQLLHELRTPVGAIQGFAEIIQQQLFGAVPHEYRAHAAAISVDAAKILAGFDEIDRLVKLEGRAMQLENGSSDLREALSDTLRRVDGVLAARNAGFDFTVSGSPFTLAISRNEALTMCWRLLATAAGALGPGERISLSLHGDGEKIRLDLDVPVALRGIGSEERGEPLRRPVLSAGMFGPHFAFRLSQAEIAAAGGSLTCSGEQVEMHLPALTGVEGGHSTA